MNALVLQRRRQSQRAFTLLEVLLTLGVLVIISGLSWPLINRSFDGQRLKMAADQVRAEIGSARAQAINSGQIQALQFGLGGASYTVSPWQPEGLPLQGATSFATATMDASPTVVAPTSIVQGNLPSDVVFYAGGMPMLAMAPAASASAAPDVTQAAGALQVLMFYPDGTTSTGKVWIVNSRGRAIGIELRGLTGVALVGDIIAQEQVEL